MKDKKGLILMILGGGMIILSVILLLYNLYDEKRAERETNTILSQLTEKMSQEPLENIQIDGNYYIGYIEIPILFLSLPVLRDFSDSKLKIAPARYFGNVQENNLIIAAHNYKSHFGYLSMISIGDCISFHDTKGNIFYYEVTDIEEINEKDVESMFKGEWDLTLFTCDYTMKERITVRCSRTG